MDNTCTSERQSWRQTRWATKWKTNWETDKERDTVGDKVGTIETKRATSWMRGRCADGVFANGVDARVGTEMEGPGGHERLWMRGRCRDGVRARAWMEMGARGRWA